MFFGITLASPAAFATSVADLCGAPMEGTYLSPDGNGGHVRIDIFCLDGQRIFATVADTGLVGKAPFTSDWAYLSNSAMDGDDLILSNFQIAPDQRAAGSSKSIVSYLRLDAASLAKGELKGLFTGRIMPGFLPIAAKRTQSYPELMAALSSPLKAEAVRGSYVITGGTWTGAQLVFDVLAGVPVISIIDAGGSVNMHLTDGLAWNGNGLVSLATPEGNGGEPDDHTLDYLRGRFVSADELDFFLVIPAQGIVGPLKAKRVP